MSYKIAVDVIGAKEMADAFTKAPKEVGGILKGALGKTAALVERKAKNYAPINYGALRGSIHTEGPYVTNLNVEAKVGTNLEYAQYQEYGTGVFGPNHAPIRPKRARVLAWGKGSGGKPLYFARRVQGVKPKYYMKKSREEAIPLLDIALKDASNQIFEVLLK